MVASLTKALSTAGEVFATGTAQQRDISGSDATV
jgi:hypothetical protein